MAKAKLTQEMIDEGKPETTSKCPVALFFWKEIPSAQMICVDVADAGEGPYPMVEINIDGNIHHVVFTDPDKVADFITRFDNGKKVKPFFIEYEDF